MKNQGDSLHCPEPIAPLRGVWQKNKSMHPPHYYPPPREGAAADTHHPVWTGFINNKQHVGWSRQLATKQQAGAGGSPPPASLRSPLEAKVMLVMVQKCVQSSPSPKSTSVNCTSRTQQLVALKM